MNNEIKILLTINLEGVAIGTLAKRVDKQVLNNVKASPFAKITRNGSELIPNGHFKAQNDYTPRIIRPAKRKVKISQDAYDYYTSSSRADTPVNFKPWLKPGVQGKEWLRLSERERLEWHLLQIAEGNSFQYEIIEN